MKLRRFGVVRFMLMASILLPGIPVPGLFLARPEEILAFVLLPALLSKGRKRLTWIDLSFALIGISASISMAWGTLILGVRVSPRDITEFARIIKAWTLFRLALAPWGSTELASMAKTLLMCVSVSALIGIIEWQDWLGLRVVLQGIYGTGTGNVGTWRMIGTVGNPNYYGLLMALGLVLAVNLLNHNQRRAWTLFALTAFGLCGVVLVLTYSRSAILATALAIGLSLLVRIPRLRYRAAWHAVMRVKWQRFVMTILIIGATIWTWNQLRILGTLTTPAETSLYWRRSPLHRVLYRLSAVDVGFEARVERFWKANVALIAESPLFGWGAAKGEHRTVADSGFIRTLRRYGFLGLLSHLLLYWQVTWVLFRTGWASVRDSICDRLAITALTITAGYLVANFFMEALDHLQLTSLHWLLIGIAASKLFYARVSPSPHPSLSETRSRVTPLSAPEGSPQ